MNDNSSYININVDDLGRVVIPKKFRDKLKIVGNSSVKISLENNYLKITNDNKESLLAVIYNSFGKAWVENNSEHVVLMLDRLNIKYILGYKSSKFKNKKLSRVIIEKINDIDFTYEKLINIDLFNDRNLYSCKLIKVLNDDGIIGGLLIIDNDDISNKQLKFIFDIVNKIVNGGIKNE